MTTSHHYLPQHDNEESLAEKVTTKQKHWSGKDDVAAGTQQQKKFEVNEQLIQSD